MFVPGDNAITGPLASIGVLAGLLAEDWVAEGADHRQLIAEAEELLEAIDLAISGADFTGDEDGEQMQRCWAFLGPGLHKDIQQMKASTLRGRHLYPRIAVVMMTLTTRRQTLEMNDIHVLKRSGGWIERKKKHITESHHAFGGLSFYILIKVQTSFKERCKPYWFSSPIYTPPRNSAVRRS